MSMTIADAAGATGFSASALRFYETAGLIAPGRTASGYRSYSDNDLATLRFIGRAKRLGLSLEEIAELVPLLAGDRCAPVQEQLRAVVLDKIADTERRSADLLGFLAQLRRMVAWLDRPPADGACDDRCACTTDPATAPPAAPPAVDDGSGAIRPPSPDEDAPIACTLGPADFDERIAAWQALSATALAREAIAGGVRLRLPRDAVHLDTVAPVDGLPLVHAIVGAPA